MTWQRFFELNGQYVISLKGETGKCSTVNITVEELYQFFKKRYEAEDINNSVGKKAEEGLGIDHMLPLPPLPR